MTVLKRLSLAIFVVMFLFVGFGCKTVPKTTYVITTPAAEEPVIPETAAVEKKAKRSDSTVVPGEIPYNNKESIVISGQNPYGGRESIVVPGKTPFGEKTD